MEPRTLAPAKMRGRHATWVIIALFVVDRILKYYAQNLPPGKVFALFPGLEFGYSLNPSLFSLPAWGFVPWLALAVLIGVGLVVVGQSNLFGSWLSIVGKRMTATHNQTGSHDYQPKTMPFLLVLLGGASNVFDRFTYGGVIDYVNILGIATVNLADILILIGLIGLLNNPGRR